MTLVHSAPPNSTLVVNTPAKITALNATSVKKHLQDAITDAHVCVELRMHNTRFIDSSGLGFLVYLHKTVTARSGRIRLLNPSPRVQQLLEATRMGHLFEILS